MFQGILLTKTEGVQAAAVAACDLAQGMDLSGSVAPFMLLLAGKVRGRVVVQP